MTMPFDVVVVGNVGIDTNVYLRSDEINWDVEANFTDNRDYVGQAGGYTSRGFAQLRRTTAFVGYVGHDYHGQMIRDAFAHDGIDTTALFVDPAGTSRSVNMMYRDGRRKNFYDGKSHMQLQPDLAVCSDVLARARLALFHLPNWARHLLPVAKQHGVTIACDLQDVVAVNDPYRQDFIAHADIVLCSAANHGDPTDLISTLLRAHPHQIVIVGMGARGCALGTRDGVTFFPAVDGDEPISDTNGAGDGLAVGFLTSYVLDNYSLADAIRRGQIAARHTCALKAMTSQLITPEQLEERWQRDHGAASKRNSNTAAHG